MFEKLKQFCTPLATKLNLSAELVCYIALGLTALILVLIIVIIAVSISKGKKRKADKEMVGEKLKDDKIDAEKVEQAPVVEEIPAVDSVAITKDVDSPKTKVPADEKPVAMPATFEERLVVAEELLKANYQELKDALLSYKKVTSRVSKKYDSIRIGRTLLAKIAISGKTLRCYLALNPEDYKMSTYHQRNCSDKVIYQNVPLLMRIRSKRAIKNTLTLVNDLADKFQLVKK